MLNVNDKTNKHQHRSEAQNPIERVAHGLRESGLSVIPIKSDGSKLVRLVEVPNHRLYGTKIAAKYLGIHPDTLREYADLGWIAPRRINKRRVFILEDLDAFIDSLPCYDDPGGKPGGKEINNGN